MYVDRIHLVYFLSRVKMAKDIVDAYMREVYYKYGGSRKILSDNGTEFKNELFTTVAKKLGVEHKIYSPPFHPQSNGRIEGSIIS